MPLTTRCVPSILFYALTVTARLTWREVYLGLWVFRSQWSRTVLALRHAAAYGSLRVLCVTLLLVSDIIIAMALLRVLNGAAPVQIQRNAAGCHVTWVKFVI